MVCRFIIDDSDFLRESKNPELNMLEGNDPLWKRRYLNTDYATTIPGNKTIRPECWDIYTFPLFNELFAKHLIENAESYGKVGLWHGVVHTIEPLTWSYHMALPSITAPYLRPPLTAYGNYICLQWESSRYGDSRLKGAHVPPETEDIHFSQIGFGATWKEAFQTFIAPIAETVYSG
jgi:hypothetical protein